MPCEAIDCYFRDNQGRCDEGFCEDILVAGLNEVIVYRHPEMKVHKHPVKTATGWVQQARYTMVGHDAVPD